MNNSAPNYLNGWFPERLAAASRCRRPPLALLHVRALRAFVLLLHEYALFSFGVRGFKKSPRPGKVGFSPTAHQPLTKLRTNSSILYAARQQKLVTMADVTEEVKVELKAEVAEVKAEAKYEPLLVSCLFLLILFC